MSTATYPEPTIARPLRDLITIVVVVAAILGAATVITGQRDAPAPVESTARPAAALTAESRRLEALAAYWAARDRVMGTQSDDTPTPVGPRSDAATDAESRRLEALAAYWSARTEG